MGEQAFKKYFNEDTGELFILITFVSRKKKKIYELLRII